MPFASLGLTSPLARVAADQGFVHPTPIQTAAQNVQENVRKAIETMTGLHVVRVDVHVQGVSFEKENKDTQAGLDELHSSVAEVAAMLELEERTVYRDWAAARAWLKDRLADG